MKILLIIVVIHDALHFAFKVVKLVAKMIIYVIAQAIAVDLIGAML